MSNKQSVESFNKQEEEKELKLKLVIDNDKKWEPPDGDKNWLDKMVIGACFVAKEIRNPQEIMMPLFRIGSRTEKTTVLNSPQIPGNIYTDSNVFCNKYRCHEDLGVMITPNEENEIKEIANDDGDRVEPDSGHPDGKVE